MTTQEMTKQEMIMNLREKREEKKKAKEFRIWATKILKEYMTKGFALNDERFINGNKY